MSSIEDTRDVHTLSGAYALDALDELEARAFEKHLEGCQACRQEVRELQDAAAEMGAMEQAAPPEALRERVLRAAERTPQQPPRVQAPAPRQDRPATGPSPAPRRRPRWLAPVAAAAAAVVIALGGVALSQLPEDDTAPMAAPVHQVFTASDVHSTTVETINGGRLTVATSRALGKMAIDTHALPSLPGDRVYQLWTMHDGLATSQGVLTDLGSGAAMAMPPKGEEVAITVEPTGGSDRPTSQPIVTVNPTAV